MFKIKGFIKWLVMANCFFVFMLATIVIFILTPDLPVQGSSIIEPIQTSSLVGIPTRLEIPKIGVNSDLEYVGLTANGDLGAPNGPANAAWFDLGPRPGEKGTAIIDGHSGWKNGIPAVFDHLNKLEKGDKIYVVDNAGATVTFVVRESRLYDPLADASKVFNSNDDKAHLNLITCEGIWNKSEKSYSNRLVVFADKEI